MNIATAVLLLMVLIFSIVCHEVAHGWMAYKFGDDTAKNAGRLTLNPIPHLDLLGSFLVPAMLYFLKVGIILGWAKPVPINPEKFQPQRLGMVCVSLAGIAVNFTIAVLAALVLRLTGIDSSYAGLLYFVVLINVVLGVFNLIPIPPLDGSRLWMMWLSKEAQMKLESMALFFFVVLIMLLPYLPIFSVIMKISLALAGIDPSLFNQSAQ